MTTGKLFARASWAASAAFAFGLCLGSSLIATGHNRLYCGAAMALAGAVLVFVLLWTSRAVWRLVTSETARESAGQFLWSCVFFSMLSLSFGVMMSGLAGYGADFFRIFLAVCNGVFTSVGIYCVCRDAKRLADAR